MRQDNQAAAAEATVDHAAHADLLDDLMARVAPCSARRQTRPTCRDMVNGLLCELEDYNCWTLAGAAGRASPYRMQHLLSRARCDERQLLDAAAGRAAAHLAAGQDEDDVVLIVDETADEKSSAGCADAARQYSGTVGGIAMCQVAVTLTCAAPAGHALIGRSLYLPADWAADEERRELAAVPDEIMSATKPQLAGDLLQHAHDRGIRAGFVAGDEVCGGLDLRRSIRERGTGYVLAVRSNCMVTLPSGRRLTVKTAASLVKPAMWQRMQAGSATRGARDYHWAMTEITPDDTPRRAGPRARRAAAPPAPLYRHRQQLPVLDTGPGAAGEADQSGRHQVENRRGSPAAGAGQRAGQRPGHHLDLLAPLDCDQPARLRVPRHGRRLTARRGHRRERARPDPRHRARTAQTAPRHCHPRTQPRQAAPRCLGAAATPSPVRRTASSPAMACLRRRGATVTIYNCHNYLRAI